MRSNVFLISLFILACLLITPVLATEIAQGDIPGDIGWTSFNLQSNGTNGLCQISGDGGVHITFNNTEYTTGIKSIVHYDEVGYITTYNGNTTPSAWTNVVLKNPTGNKTIVTGTIGYQRFFSGFPAVEQPGFQYIIFDDNTFNVSNTTPGSYQAAELFYDTTKMTGSIKLTEGNDLKGSPLPSGYARFCGAYPGKGLNIYNVQQPFGNSYYAVKPGGLGITGTVYKNLTNESTSYPSRIYVVNATSGQTITSESTVTTNPFYFNLPVERIIISAQDSIGSYHNTSILFNQSIVTPTPTPTIGPLDYTLALNKTAVNFGESISATIASDSDPTLTHINGISYTYESPTSTPNTVSFFESGSTSDVMNYYLYGATWKGYNTTTAAWTNTKAGIPNPSTLKFQETGQIEVHCIINTDNGDNLDIHIPVLVGSGSFITTTFQAYDGSNYALLQGVKINVLNLNTGIWTNGTYYNGKVSITTPPNQILSAYGNKSGYFDAKYENAVTDGTPYSLVFYQIGAPPETNNQTFYVNTFTSTGTRVTGALVIIKESGTNITLTKTTNNAGVATFTLKFSTLYTITPTKTGYVCYGTSVTTNTGMSDSINLICNPSVTATLTPIGSWTVSPYNQTGNTTFWKPWTDLFNQMGASNYEMPLLLAAFILLILMVTGFAMAGILGGEIALGFGAILCVAIGLIPIWVVLAIIIIGFLFYGLKMVK
jgi:hypothetical protein